MRGLGVLGFRKPQTGFGMLGALGLSGLNGRCAVGISGFGA